MNLRPFRFCWVLFFCVMAAAQSSTSPTPQAEQHSAITIKVFKSGLFSGFAHNHVVTAPISRASLDAKAMTAEILVAAREMKVMDAEVSQKDRAEIQNTMMGPKVLDAEKFPEIRFQSTRIEQTSQQHFLVTGMLELHGTKHAVTLEVTGTAEHYHGVGKLKQSDFGIKPISLGGGSVKVKDELELEFDVYPALPGAGR